MNLNFPYRGDHNSNYNNSIIVKINFILVYENSVKPELKWLSYAWESSTQEWDSIAPPEDE